MFKKKFILFLILFFFSIAISFSLYVLKSSYSQFYTKDSPSKTTTNSAYEDKIQMAYNLLQQKDKSLALKFMLEWPEDLHQFESLKLLGITLLQNEQYQDSIPIFEKSLLKLNKAKDELYLNKKKDLSFLIAKAFEASGNIDKALDQNFLILDWFPNNLIALSNIGHLFLKKKNLDKAEYYYQQVFQLDSKFQSGLSGLAQISKIKKNWSEAKNYYNQLLEHYPNYAIYYMELSDVYFQEGNLNKHYELLAKGYFISKRYEESIIYLNKMPNLLKNKKLHELLIINYIHVNEIKKAEQEILKALSIDPNDISYQFQLANVYYHQKLFIKSENILKKLITQNSNMNAHILILLGHNNLALEKKNIATNYYEKALNINIQDIQTREHLAQIYRLEGEKNKEYLHQAIVYFLLEDIEQADVVFSWIDENSVHIPLQYHYYKGMLLLEKKNIAEAIKSFEKSLTYAEVDNTYYSKNYLALISVYEDAKNLIALQNLKDKFQNEKNTSKINDYLFNTIQEKINKINF